MAVRQHLSHIDRSLLGCSEKFIRQQVVSPLNRMSSKSELIFPISSAEGEWFDIYSIYAANQQLNEACNKCWAIVELVHATSPSIWRTAYFPIGSSFGQPFLMGTVLPTLYYANISAIISAMSSLGVITLRKEGRPYYLIRT